MRQVHFSTRPPPGPQPGELTTLHQTPKPAAAMENPFPISYLILRLRRFVRHFIFWPQKILHVRRKSGYKCYGARTAKNFNPLNHRPIGLTAPGSLVRLCPKYLVLFYFKARVRPSCKICCLFSYCLRYKTGMQAVRRR